jgi:polyphosphate kinase 2 (PPK2 family)
VKIHLKHFRVPQGKKVDLHERPTEVDPFYTSKQDYQTLLAEHVETLRSLQQLHYASSKHAVLVNFRAMGTAGKDGVIAPSDLSMEQIHTNLRTNP